MTKSQSPEDRLTRVLKNAFWDLPLDGNYMSDRYEEGDSLVLDGCFNMRELAKYILENYQL